MRRLAACVITVAALATTVTLAFGGAAHGSSSASFDVIFDDARGLIAGQLVKVAGAKAGTIDKVIVTPNFKARIEASIDSRFMPFHTNAHCVIRPEGLIAENYIDCDPGNAPAPVLKAGNGYPPTVPVQNTTEPVSLLDLFNIFNVPTGQRLGVILDELGIGTAGEGQDFNDIIRRANPALAYARRALSVLNAQRTQLTTILDSTSAIAAQAAGHTAALQQFLDHAASVTATTAAHSGSLSAAINRLPGLLAAARPALARLDTVAVQGTPLVNELHAAAPALNTVADRLGPFVAVAKPALRKLGGALDRAVPAIRDATPLVATIERYLKGSLPSTEQIGTLFTNLQQRGFVENFLSLVYYLSALTARYDSIGHLGVAYLLDANNGLCALYATTPVPGCSANYGSQPKASAARNPAGSARSTRPAQPHRRLASAPRRPAPSSHPAPAAPAPAASAQTASPSPAPSPLAQTLQNLLGFLLR